VPDTLIGDRRYNVVTHIRMRRRPVVNKASKLPVLVVVRSGTRGQRKMRPRTELVSVTTIQLESYERQERKRQMKLHGVTNKRLRALDKALKHGKVLNLGHALIASLAEHTKAAA
jgi:hypothetical protein